MEKRRPSDNGIVRKRPDGRWEGRVIIGYDEKNLPETKSVTAKTKSKCLDKLKKLKEWLGQPNRRKYTPECPLGIGWISGIRTTPNRNCELPPGVAMRDVFADTSSQDLDGKTVDSRCMFPSPAEEDSPMDPASARRRLHAIMEHAQCKQVRFHDLCHTFATTALGSGMDVKTLSAMLGHVSVATTLDIYNPCHRHHAGRGSGQDRLGHRKSGDLSAISDGISDKKRRIVAYMRSTRKSPANAALRER